MCKNLKKKIIFIITIICFIVCFVGIIYSVQFYTKYKANKQLIATCKNQNLSEANEILNQYSNNLFGEKIKQLDNNGFKIVCLMNKMEEIIENSRKTNDFTELNNAIKVNKEILNFKVSENNFIDLMTLSIIMASNNSELNQKIVLQNLKIIEILLQNGADANYIVPKDMGGFTLIEFVFASSIGDDKNDNRFFDLDNNNFKEQTAWISPNDGLLVYDRNGKFTYSNLNQISKFKYVNLNKTTNLIKFAA